MPLSEALWATTQGRETTRSGRSNPYRQDLDLQEPLYGSGLQADVPEALGMASGCP